MILLTIFGLKIFMPLYLIYLHFLSFNFIAVASISGFYVYIILLLYKILDNEDLKKRLNIVGGVAQMLDFELEDDEKPKEEEAGGASGAANASIKKYGIDLNNKIDITCPISLETWDNCRRISLILDREKSQKF